MDIFQKAEWSDDFFNRDHPHYKELFYGRGRSNGPTWEEREAAILKDAQEYWTPNKPHNPEWFAKDFLRRL